MPTGALKPRLKWEGKKEQKHYREISVKKKADKNIEFKSMGVQLSDFQEMFASA